MKAGLLLISLWAFTACWSPGQDVPAAPAPILPPGPWPAKAPSMAAWVIEISLGDPSSSDKAAASGATQDNAKKGMSIVVTKTLPVVHEVQTDGDGKIWDKWYKDGYEVTTASDSPLPMISKGPSDPVFFHDYDHSDFDGFEWLAKSNFKGTESVDGRTCFLFKARMRVSGGLHMTLVSDSAGSSSLSEPIIDVQADLDAKSLLPVQLIIGQKKQTYKFLPPPEALQSFPDKLQQLLDDQAKRLRAVSGFPARPY